MKRISIYHDGMPIDSNSNADLAPLFERYPKSLSINRNSSSTLSFVGFVLSGKEIICSLPKGYHVPPSDDAEGRDWLLTVLHALLSYQSTGQFEYDTDFSPASDMRSVRLAAALEILEDYLTHGLIRRPRIELRKGALGAIDWNATIRRSPVFHSDNSALYAIQWTRKRVDDDLDVIRRIQACITIECLDIWGWLFDIGPNDAPELQTEQFSYDFMVSSLRRAKIATFSQRELALIDLLLSYLINPSAGLGTKHIEVIGTAYFDRVWEYATKTAFGDLPSLQSKLVPQPKWERDDGAAINLHDKKTRQVPDVLSRHNDTLLIIDAKYYDLERSLPGWPDIVKQIYYRESIERKLKRTPDLKTSTGLDKTANAFVFPGIPGSGYIRKTAHAYLPDVSEVGGWGYVDSYSVDVNECLKCYASGQPNRQWIKELAKVAKNID